MVLDNWHLIAVGYIQFYLAGFFFILLRLVHLPTNQPARRSKSVFMWHSVQCTYCTICCSSVLIFSVSFWQHNKKLKLVSLIHGSLYVCHMFISIKWPCCLLCLMEYILLVRFYISLISCSFLSPVTGYYVEWIQLMEFNFYVAFRRSVCVKGTNKDVLAWIYTLSAL